LLQHPYLAPFPRYYQFSSVRQGLKKIEVTLFLTGRPGAKGTRIEGPRGYGIGRGFPLPSASVVWEGAMPVGGGCTPPQKNFILRLKMCNFMHPGVLLEFKTCKKHRLKPYADSSLHAPVNLAPLGL